VRLVVVIDRGGVAAAAPPPHIQRSSIADHPSSENLRQIPAMGRFGHRPHDSHLAGLVLGRHCARPFPVDPSESGSSASRVVRQGDAHLC
jgi:hypothetical protein